jgi:hypothetical protein
MIHLPCALLLRCARALIQAFDSEIDGHLETFQRFAQARLVVRLGYEPRLARVGLTDDAEIVQRPAPSPA